MTREEMINAIIEDVDNWDIPNLIGWVQFEMRAKLNDLSTDDIVEEYVMVVDNEY